MTSKLRNVNMALFSREEQNLPLQATGFNGLVEQVEDMRNHFGVLASSSERR